MEPLCCVLKYTPNNEHRLVACMYVSSWLLRLDLKVPQNLGWIYIAIPPRLLGASHHGKRRRWAAGRGRSPCTWSENGYKHRQVRSSPASKCIKINKVSKHGSDGLLVGQFGCVKVELLSVRQFVLYEPGPARSFSLLRFFWQPV